MKILLLRMMVVLIVLLYNPIEMGFAEHVEIEKQKQPVDLHSFILDFECRGGPSEKNLTAYWDHKGYSIGCGTPSYKGERISKKEALRRFYEYTDIRFELVKRHFPNLTGDKLTAVVSLASNNGTCYRLLRQGKLSRSGWLSCDKVRKDGKLVALRGLTARRIAEVHLFYGKK